MRFWFQQFTSAAQGRRYSDRRDVVDAVRMLVCTAALVSIFSEWWYRDVVVAVQGLCSDLDEIVAQLFVSSVRCQRVGVGRSVMAPDGVGERDLIQRDGVQVSVQLLDLVLALSNDGGDLLRSCRQGSAEVQHVASCRLFGLFQSLLALVKPRRLHVVRAGGQLYNAE